MSTIELTNDMMTGVAKIDAQHKELVSRINAVLAMGTKAVSTEETRKTIDFLGEYIIKHFGEEEALQRQSKYDKYEWHKQQHAIYIDSFKKIKADFLANGASPKFTASLNTSIVHWIINHIKNVDVAFGKYYKSQKA